MSAVDASPARGGTFADDPQHLLRLYHDLRQYVAAGLLLSELPADAVEDGAVLDRLSLIHQQFGAIAELLDVEQEPARRIGGVNLTRLAAECAEVFRLTYRLPVIVERSARVMATGDHALLRRAIGNLLDNACRAAGSSGNVCVRIEETDGEACVEVSDDGPGFGAVASGTGHGLQVVAAAVRACGARLEIRSSPVTGTAVRLCLPAGHRPVRPA
jgi:signal transduction histidine kinase